MGQERLGPSYFFIPLVLGPLNSLVWYVPSLRYTRGLGCRMHCCAEVTESSINKQHHLSRRNTRCSPQAFSIMIVLVTPKIDISVTITDTIVSLPTQVRLHTTLSATRPRRLAVGVESAPLRSAVSAAQGISPPKRHWGVTPHQHWHMGSVR